MSPLSLRLIPHFILSATFDTCCADYAFGSAFRDRDGYLSFQVLFERTRSGRYFCGVATVINATGGAPGAMSAAVNPPPRTKGMLITPKIIGRNHGFENRWCWLFRVSLMVFYRGSECIVNTAWHPNSLTSWLDPSTYRTCLPLEAALFLSSTNPK